jgi:hypothetical protein
MTMIKIGLAVFCALICIFALLLPEKSAFAFNLDYLEYLNRNQQFILNSSSSTARKNTCRIGSLNVMGRLNFATCGLDTSNCADSIETDSVGANKKDGYLNTSITTMANSIIQNTPSNKILEYKAYDDNETSLLANSLIKKINCENHCKTGKLNPLYEEEQITISSSSFNVNNNAICINNNNQNNNANNNNTYNNNNNNNNINGINPNNCQSNNNSTVVAAAITAIVTANPATNIPTPATTAGLAASCIRANQISKTAGQKFSRASLLNEKMQVIQEGSTKF